MPIRSLTIDLDGTLVDTIDDLAAASNAMLADLGRPARAVADIRRFVGEGMRVLVERCLDGEATTEAALLEAGIAAFRRRYAECNGEQARVYPGVVSGLQALHGAGLALACVTNKPAEFAVPLLQRVGLAEYFPVVVAGDTLPVKKPHPGPILHACASLGSTAATNVHVGDSRHDVEAARAAGSRPLFVGYGYGEAVDRGDDATLVSSLAEVAEWVGRRNCPQSSEASS